MDHLVPTCKGHRKPFEKAKMTKKGYIPLCTETTAGEESKAVWKTANLHIIILYIHVHVHVHVKICTGTCAQMVSHMCVHVHVFIVVVCD